MIVETWREKSIRYRHILKQHLVYKILRREWQKPVLSLKNKHINEKCFIFATGPSVNEMDLDLVQSCITNEGFSVIGVNSFNSSDLATRFSPRYALISDPCYLDEPETSKYKPKFIADLERMKSIKNLTLILPHQWFDRISELNLFPAQEKAFFFNCENFPAKPTGCNLLAQRYYVSLTAYKAIIAAAYMGFREIYLLGFDEDYVSGLSIDENNHIIWQDRHFYPDDEAYKRRDMTVEANLTFEVYCANIIRSCISQRKINSDVQSLGGAVFNCNPNSYVIGFPKTKRFYRNEV
jgi:hypothetical protein